MYRLELDMVTWFVPPMLDNGRGIRVTRTIEIPFPPSKHIALHSKGWEGIDDPMGYRLKDVVWDMDAGCFLAETHTSASGVPIAMIPGEIKSLINQGWRWGSYRDKYERERGGERKRKPLAIMRTKKWDWDEAGKWEVSRSTNRPKEFTTILQSVVGLMAGLMNNVSVAYAILKTGTFIEVEESDIPKERSPAEKKFVKFQDEFEKLSFDEQWDWCKKVQRRLPRFLDVVEATR